MPKPAKNARRCGLHQLPGVGEHSKRNVETVSLFDLKRTNGWWPAVGTDDEEQILAVRHSICNVYLHTSQSRETLGFITERVHNFSLVRVQREEWHEKKERGASCQERANTPTVFLLTVLHATP